MTQKETMRIKTETLQRHFFREGWGEVRANRKIISRTLSQKEGQYKKNGRQKTKETARVGWRCGLVPSQHRYHRQPLLGEEEGGGVCGWSDQMNVVRRNNIITARLSLRSKIFLRSLTSELSIKHLPVNYDASSLMWVVVHNKLDPVSFCYPMMIPE